jgi:hypothetical protein
MDHSNDNDPLTFEPIGLAAERIANLLKACFSEPHEKTDSERTENSDRSGANENEPAEHRRAVDQRLAQLRAFERRYTKG